MRRIAVLLGFGLVLACGKGKAPVATAPAPSVQGNPALVDSLWRTAERQFRAGDWNKSSLNLERLLLESLGTDPRLIRAHFLLAECYFAQNDHLRAAREFRRVSDETPNDSLAPVALLRAGDAYSDLWRRPELDPSYGQQGLATYQELLSRYPDSPVAARARDRVAGLQDKFAEKSFKSALYYLRLKAFDSAILYFRDLLATYPRSTIAPQALLRLIEAYKAIGYTEEVKETCGYFRTNHPTAPGIDRACPLATDTT
ncbi:MAG: outer membrane protein assembly factor BamD [Gemmatimonadota bacterium]